MTFAIIKTGGKQYIAREGEILVVERLASAEPLKEGDTVTFDEVLLVSDGKGLAIGNPTVTGKKVQATFSSEIREAKKTTYKYKPKARTRVKRGSRQFKAEVTVSKIS